MIEEIENKFATKQTSTPPFQTMQSIKHTLLHATVLAVSFTTLFAQDGEQQGEGLNRETVEHLLKVVSPSCREEMTEALAEQSELSLECKEEIQSALRERDGSAARPAPPGANPATPVIDDRSNSAYWIVIVFVFFLCCGLVYVAFMIADAKKKLPGWQDERSKSKKQKAKEERKQKKKEAKKQKNKQN
jgi:hypothetical protein